MAFSMIDIVFLVVILIFTIIGVVKGFIDNIFGKLSWILAILGAFFFYDRVAVAFLSGIGNKIVENILSFLILFVVIFIVVKLIQVVLQKIFSGAILGSLDRALGFFFGIVEGLAIVTLIIFLLANQPFFSIDGLSSGSFFFELFNKYLSNFNVEGIITNV